MDTSWTGNCKGGPSISIPLLILDDGTGIDAQIAGTLADSDIIGVNWFVHGPTGTTASEVLDAEDWLSTVAYSADQAPGTYVVTAFAFRRSVGTAGQIKIGVMVNGKGAANSSPVGYGDVFVATATLAP